jgi:hypothetical protein
MTSDEIKNTPDATAEFWLKELAYQVAIANERTAPMTREESFALSDAVLTALRDREKNGA